jgi:hypothetical protein
MVACREILEVACGVQQGRIAVQSRPAKATQRLEQGSHLSLFLTAAVTTSIKQLAYPLALKKNLSKKKSTENVTFLPGLT